MDNLDTCNPQWLEKDSEFIGNRISLAYRNRQNNLFQQVLQRTIGRETLASNIMMTMAIITRITYTNVPRTISFMTIHKSI